MQSLPRRRKSKNQKLVTFLLPQSPPDSSREERENSVESGASESHSGLVQRSSPSHHQASTQGMLGWLQGVSRHVLFGLLPRTVGLSIVWGEGWLWWVWQLSRPSCSITWLGMLHQTQLLLFLTKYTLGIIIWIYYVMLFIASVISIIKKMIVSSYIDLSKNYSSVIL